MLPKQPADVASKLRKDAVNTSRAFADTVDALARYRGKGPQVVRVERVIVNEGGQAVVGNGATEVALPASGPTPQAIGQSGASMPMLNAVPASVQTWEGEGA